MPRRLQVKPTLRYRYAYWAFSIMVVLFIIFKDHGETVVEHPVFILISLCMLVYCPFWLSRSIQTYEEQVQEEEICAIDKQALRYLNRMSLSYR